jgi:hypothetical protein
MKKIDLLIYYKTLSVEFIINYLKVIYIYIVGQRSY